MKHLILKTNKKIKIQLKKNNKFKQNKEYKLIKNNQI